MASTAKQWCRMCGGESFTTTHGLKVCDQCGGQEEGYIELLSQETIGEVDRTRLIKTSVQDPKEEDKAPPPQEKKLNNWTTYEAYNCVLYEWTKAMVSLGASEKFPEVMFKLWVAYLQRIGVAFVQKQRKYSQSSLKNNRDMKLIHEKVESVCSSSLHSYRWRKKKKKKAEPTKLDKIKDKIERKKFRDEMRKSRDSSFLNSTLTSELSKSLNEYEASRLSDSDTSFSSSHGRSSRLNTSARGEASTFGDESSYLGHCGSGSEMEREAPPCVRKKQIRRDDVVRNWIKRTTHIYSSDSEEDLQQEEGKGDETMEERSTVETFREEDEDSDQDSVTRAEGISSPEQGGTSSKRPRKCHNIKKRDYSKLCKKMEKASVKITGYRTSRLPFILSFPRLLSLLYLAVLLAEEGFLLSDIIRWCREGHIPYFSAPYLLGPNMELAYYDLNMFRSSKNLPDAQEIQASAGRLAVFLSIQSVPLPAMGGIVKKFVKLLHLPEEVATVAGNHIRMVDDMRVGMAVPPVESMAMASIIMTLKMFCGLDNHTEVMLSRAADVIKTELPDCIAAIPFSWQDWQKHIAQLVWVCCHLDPPTAFHWQPLHEVCHFNPKVFSKYFWSEGMWRLPRTSRKKKAEVQRLVEELLKQQGLTLQEAVMQPPLFEPSKHPLRGTVEQFLQRDHAAEDTETLRYIEVAEALKKESFANHSLYWIDDVDWLASELDKCGSKNTLHVTERKRNVHTTNTGNPKTTQLRQDEARDESVLNGPQELCIPHPLTHYWEIMPKKHATWKKLSPDLPSSFKWLVGVGSNVCEAPKMQIFRLLCLLQTKMKPQKWS